MKILKKNLIYGTNSEAQTAVKTAFQLVSSDTFFALPTSHTIVEDFINSTFEKLLTSRYSNHYLPFPWNNDDSNISKRFSSYALAVFLRHETAFLKFYELVSATQNAELLVKIRNVIRGGTDTNVKEDALTKKTETKMTSMPTKTDTKTTTRNPVTETNKLTDDLVRKTDTTYRGVAATTSSSLADTITESPDETRNTQTTERKTVYDGDDKEVNETKYNSDIKETTTTSTDVAPKTTTNYNYKSDEGFEDTRVLDFIDRCKNAIKDLIDDFELVFLPPWQEPPWACEAVEE